MAMIPISPSPMPVEVRKALRGAISALAKGREGYLCAVVDTDPPSVVIGGASVKMESNAGLLEGFMIGGALTLGVDMIERTMGWPPDVKKSESMMVNMVNGIGLSALGAHDQKKRLLVVLLLTTIYQSVGKMYEHETELSIGEIGSELIAMGTMVLAQDVSPDDADRILNAANEMRHKIGLPLHSDIAKGDGLWPNRGSV